jgi:hypothetical protein
MDNVPQIKNQPPVRPREEQQKKIDIMESYLSQLEARGAPEWELKTQRQKIAQEKLYLSLMTD